jgi:hypothetical protein
MRPERRAARVQADRWALWLRALELGLPPVPQQLALDRAAQQERGERLFSEVLLPGLGPDFAPQLAAAETPLAALAGQEFRRMAAVAHRLARGLCALHAAEEAHAEASARCAIWLTLAAAVLDQKLDDGLLAADVVRQHLNPTAFLAAVEHGQPLRMPGQPLVERLLACTTAEMAARLAAARSELDARVLGELRICLTEMIVGQLDSPRLRIHPLSELDEVERTLRRVNLLTTWVPAYLGLLGAAAPPAEATLRAVRQITTRIGEVGWALDALSDVHADLEAGVWSLVWLDLARRSAPGARWLREHADHPELALDALAASDTIATLLAEIGLAIEEIERMPFVDPQAAAELAALCRYLVWSFLLAAPPGQG